MATATAAPASVASSLAPKANDSRKAVVPVDTSELEKHVLAVDDKSVDRAAIARILRGSRYRVTAVESATRALELLAMGLIPDVSMIITDYWMSGMTEYELLKRVKESAALRGIYVVIIPDVQAEGADNAARQLQPCVPSEAPAEGHEASSCAGTGRRERRSHANRGDQDFSAVYEAVKGAGGSGGQA
uniref:Response regulatory domain-containing protein n=1 Tax=Zea mays TaxID=4577 RepID=A0A804PK47_MAIZE